MRPKIVNLTKSHFRKEFDSGKDLLDKYIKQQARQDVQRKLSACFVISERENDQDKVKGYYTLSNYGIPRDLIPDNLNKRFPKSYETIPVTLLGRLALDKSKFKQGLGEYLLMDALHRSYLASLEVASFAVVVDPIDDEAIAFYSRYDFELLPDSEKMFLPMVTIEQLFED